MVIVTYDFQYTNYSSLCQVMNSQAAAMKTMIEAKTRNQPYVQIMQQTIALPKFDKEMKVEAFTRRLILYGLITTLKTVNPIR